MKTLVMLIELGPIQIGVAILLLLCLVPLIPLLLGAVLIRERQVGIVVKKFGGGALEPGRLIALNPQRAQPAPGGSRQAHPGRPGGL
jgi:hypothetical protein